MTQKGEVRVLLVRTAELACAIPLGAIVETMRALPCQKLPNVPSYVLGASVIRGRPTPVVNLSILLGQTAPSTCRRYVLLGGVTMPIALAVDDVVGIRSLGSASIADVPRLLRDVGEHHVASLGTLDAELIPVLSEAMILPPEVLSAVIGLSTGVAG